MDHVLAALRCEKSRNRWKMARAESTHVDVFIYIYYLFYFYFLVFAYFDLNKKTLKCLSFSTVCVSPKKMLCWIILCVVSVQCSAFYYAFSSVDSLDVTNSSRGESWGSGKVSESSLFQELYSYIQKLQINCHRIFAGETLSPSCVRDITAKPTPFVNTAVSVCPKLLKKMLTRNVCYWAILEFKNIRQQQDAKALFSSVYLTC